VDCPDSEERLEAILPEIIDAVRLSFCIHRRWPTRDETDELSQQILLLLIDSDQRRLRSFGRRASLRTWLRVVVSHHVNRYLKTRKREMGLEEIPPGSLVSLPLQESSIVSNEQAQAFQKAIEKLSERERELLQLLCRDDLRGADIARIMGMKYDSVRRRKHALIKKLQILVR
jgi:RNA polymerase sigma factor (sigma-70 family)